MDENSQYQLYAPSFPENYGDNRIMAIRDLRYATGIDIASAKHIFDRQRLPQRRFDIPKGLVGVMLESREFLEEIGFFVAPRPTTYQRTLMDEVHALVEQADYNGAMQTLEVLLES